ncbi:FAD-binding oxidoreductase [Rubrobacter indicoceani]|uniref:FAD-binding oxidoreductase n=1 Tax=Rubrobacter indicoceani TaxID=2051957 RepID=UPI000E5C0437|nr:FAD-binding oxidoreductase [Rubrobacter indicoceani]
MTDTTLPAPEQPVVEDLRAELRGALISPGDEGYEKARKVYNAMINKRPALVARCTDTADVIACVNFAREHGLILAVRGGGHNGAGLGTCEGGLVVDLSEMKGCRVDPAKRTVRVEGGATWGDVDHATHAFGLATPSGIISTTGVGGLTLGGGLGHLTRKCGLTIDNLIGVDMVLADGSFVQANADENEDLFWAVRGGGGNFGVVTSFEFRLHPIRKVIGGPTLWTLDQAPEVMRWYRDFIANAPEDLNGFFAFLTVPPGPPFPEELHLKKVCGVVWCYTGPEEHADEIFAPVRRVGPPVLHGVQEMPYPALQSAFDGLYPPGHQWYWKADFITEISDEAIEAHIEHAAAPTMQSTMHLYPVDGAAHRVGGTETAWSYREARWGMVIAGVDPDPANRERITGWAKDYWEAIHPYSSGGAYVNMMMEEGQDRVRASYRENYKRLLRVKRKYDPENLFHTNQNIKS